MSFRKLNKRGMEDKLYFTIWEGIATLTVIILLVVSVRAIVTKNTYWKNYYAADLAMIYDIENINQGDFIINYQLKTTANIPILFLKQIPYDFFLKNDRIEIYTSPRQERSIPLKYPYAKHPNINVKENTISSNFLVLSKINSLLELNVYVDEQEDICLSINTKKNIDLLKFNSISLSFEINKYAESTKSIMSVYGKTSETTELTIFFVYEKLISDLNQEKNTPLTPKTQFNIYYSNDQNRLTGQKLACMISNTIKKLNENSVIETSFEKYGGEFDSNQIFLEYLAGKQNEEYWIIIKTNNLQEISSNQFAELTRETIEQFYN